MIHVAKRVSVSRVRDRIGEVRETGLMPASSDGFLAIQVGETSPWQIVERTLLWD